MAKSYQELTQNHPCFARGQKSNKGRIHLPVSPGCNIACKFCDRQINDYEDRPGVASEVISPEEALEAVGRAIAINPDIHVAGIAGPGDTLATDFALKTFRLIKDKFPDLIKCMSTNGLMLPDRADEIIDVGVDSLTVTVNAVDPKIQAQLNSAVVYHGKRYTGEEAAKILINNQLEGIRKVASSGTSVKVNTVLVPEINKDHIETIAKTVSEAGAKIYNIIPLIPQAELAWCSAPTCHDIERAKATAIKYIDVFMHCSRCRADAVGVPGGIDISKLVYLKVLNTKQTFSHG
ncbi:MAG: radical SAM protein [Butyrivibrio sp.]|uniref:radical SAM protein n=1 Tax=Butyrivibrio sp. TaxID=28121 RepID=UPI0025F12F34|nr:radical SAM protein [Butyrivibrio sp.]MCR5770483.1 radical SAM protein [Butyrivibrio sp.]